MFKLSTIRELQEAYDCSIKSRFGQEVHSSPLSLFYATLIVFTL